MRNSLTSSYQRILSRMSKWIIYLCYSIDYFNAFDTLNGDVIIDALKYWHINNTFLKRFSSYLHGRTQRVKYAFALSDQLLLSSACLEEAPLAQ